MENMDVRLFSIAITGIIIPASYFLLKLKMPYLFWSTEDRTLLSELRKLTWNKRPKFYDATSTDNRFRIGLMKDEEVLSLYVLVDDEVITKYPKDCKNNPVAFIIENLIKKENLSEKDLDQIEARRRQEETDRLLKKVALTVEESLQGIAAPQKEVVSAPEETPRNVVRLKLV